MVLSEEKIEPTEAERALQNAFVQRVTLANLWLSILTLGLLIVIGVQIYSTTVVLELRENIHHLKEELNLIQGVLILKGQEKKDGGR